MDCRSLPGSDWREEDAGIWTHTHHSDGASGYGFGYLDDHAESLAVLNNAPTVRAIDIAIRRSRKDPAIRGNLMPDLTVRIGLGTTISTGTHYNETCESYSNSVYVNVFVGCLLTPFNLNT